MQRRPLLALLAMLLAAEAESPAMKLPEGLDPKRRALVEVSLKESEAHPALPYQYAGASPQNGGMDCSGAVFYLLGKVGIDPPRTADGQFRWVLDSGNLTRVPDDALTLDHPAFAKLKPGDLLFWAPAGEDARISHVQLFLGFEEKDHHPIMAGASDGRSYRGVKKNGFGLVDFRIPKADSPKRLIGYGPPVWPAGKKAPKP
jgi:peptidoglycan DL-endopeptidase CwlO